MQNNFKSSFFKENRKKLADSIDGSCPVVISGNGLVMRSKDDDSFPFHQDADFWYLTGLDDPELILFIDNQEEYIILPERDERFVIFSGQADVAKMQKTSGIKNFVDQKAGWQKLKEVLKNSKQLSTLIPAPRYSKSFYIYTNPFRADINKKIKLVNPKIKINDLKSKLSDLRVIKSDIEIDAISSAIEHTNKVLKTINKNFDQYKYENNIEAEITKYQIDNQLGSAFSPIIANGRNSCTLHYQQNNQKIKQTDITLIDTGYISSGYCSDITRVISKNPSTRQLEVHKAVMHIQDYAFSLLKPGVMPYEYERSVFLYAGEKLKELGLIKDSETKEIYNFFKHRTSHFLGIDCHDDGDYEKPFEENMVVTVEPGIYIEEEDLGIRIEDNVLLTRNGIVNLSKNIPNNLG